MPTSIPSPLPAIQARLDRALHQLDALDQHIERFLSTCSCIHSQQEHILWQDPYYVRVVQYRAKPSSDPPPLLCIQTGEVVHALRSTLDNLLWSLGTRFGAHPSLALFFRPTLADYNTMAKRVRLHLLPQDIQDWVLQQQPFASNPNDSPPLHRLHSLWNIDKHRQPILISCTSPNVFIGQHMRGHLDRVVVDTTSHGEVIILAEGEGDLNPEFTLEVRLPDSHETAVSFLRGVHAHLLDDVVPRFAPHFAP